LSPEKSLPNIEELSLNSNPATLPIFLAKSLHPEKRLNLQTKGNWDDIFDFVTFQDFEMLREVRSSPKTGDTYYSLASRGP